MCNQWYEIVVGVPNRLFARNTPSPIRWVREEQGGGVALCTGQVSHGCVYSDHVICGGDCSCGVQKVFEPVSRVLDVRQPAILIYCGVADCGSGFKLRSQQVELSGNISTDLQADPIGIVGWQVLGELQDRPRSTAVVFVLGVASPDKSDTPACAGVVSSLSR